MLFRSLLKTVEYSNGFKKAMYWSKKKMIIHADKYSPAFSKEAVKARSPKYNKVSFADFEAGKVNADDLWLYSSFWYKQFDDMALKTMLRQLISKWGIMSIEMQTAFERDDALLHEDGSYEYVDNVPEQTTADITATVVPEDTTMDTAATSAQGEDDIFEQLFEEQAGA